MHESGSDPSLSNLTLQMQCIESDGIIVDPSDEHGYLELQEYPEYVNTDGTMTDSDFAQKAQGMVIKSDIVHGQELGTSPSSPSQAEGIWMQIFQNKK